MSLGGCVMIGKWLLLVGSGPFCWGLEVFLLDWTLQLAAISAIASDICTVFVVWFSLPLAQWSNVSVGDLDEPSFDGCGLIFSSVSDVPPIAAASLARGLLATKLLEEQYSGVVIRDGQDSDEFESVLFILRAASGWYRPVLQPLPLQLEIDEEDGEIFLDIGVALERRLCHEKGFWDARTDRGYMMNFE